MTQNDQTARQKALDWLEYNYPIANYSSGMRLSPILNTIRAALQVAPASEDVQEALEFWDQPTKNMTELGWKMLCVLKTAAQNPTPRPPADVSEGLKLEVGQTYIARNGDVIKITHQAMYFMNCNDNRYFECGAFLHDHERDLIAIYKADVSEDERAFALTRANELLRRIDVQCNAVGHPVGGIEELKGILRKALTRAKSDERVVSVEDAKAALKEFPYMSFKMEKTIRTLLAHAAGETK